MRRGCDGDATGMRRRCDGDATEMRRGCDGDATGMRQGRLRSYVNMIFVYAPVNAITTGMVTKVGTFTTPLIDAVAFPSHPRCL